MTKSCLIFFYWINFSLYHRIHIQKKKQDIQKENKKAIEIIMYFSNDDVREIWNDAVMMIYDDDDD
jgi:hypothetical protein